MPPALPRMSRLFFYDWTCSCSIFYTWSIFLNLAENLVAIRSLLLATTNVPCTPPTGRSLSSLKRAGARSNFDCNVGEDAYICYFIILQYLQTLCKRCQQTSTQVITNLSPSYCFIIQQTVLVCLRSIGGWGS